MPVLIIILLFPLMAWAQPLNSDTVSSSNEGGANNELRFQPELLLDEDFYVVSNLRFTLLHEIAHAVIDEHSVPVLGGQEQAADQVAIMLLLMLGEPLMALEKGRSERINRELLEELLAISSEWYIEWQQAIDANNVVYWDEHPLPIQRFYDVTCLAYGSQPDLLEIVRRDHWLPVERAWGCGVSFAKSRDALVWLASRVSYARFDEHWRLKEVDRQQAHDAAKFPGHLELHWQPALSQTDKELVTRFKSKLQLERLIDDLNRVLKLPRDIPIHMEPLCNEGNAWWNSEQESIVVCYKLLGDFLHNARSVPDMIKRFEGMP